LDARWSRWRAQAERNAAAARAALDGTAFAAAGEAGRALSLEEAVVEALAVAEALAARAGREAQPE
jgi:hypothetical protein